MSHLTRSNVLISGQRKAPRIEIAGLCNELADDRHGDAFASVLDLSPAGLRIERPHRGGLLPRQVPIELELPEIDEVMWALGEVCFDHVRQVNGAASGPRLVHTTGLRIAAAASRDLRLLRDYVLDRSERSERARVARRFVHAEARWTPTLAWARPCTD
jgi:hypothetical protein